MKIVTALLAILLFSGGTLYPEKPASFWKKVDKNLNRIFNGKIITKKDVELNVKELTELKFKNNGIYLLVSDGETLGYVVFASSMGRFESFDYMVVYNPDVTVKEINVLNYTSPHGGEVASPRWLKQFIGYEGKHLKYGSDIEALTGATYSATSLVRDVEAVTVFMKTIKH